MLFRSIGASARETIICIQTRDSIHTSHLCYILILYYTRVSRKFKGRREKISRSGFIRVRVEPCRLLRLRGGRSCADSARGTRPSGLPSVACGRDEEVRGRLRKISPGVRIANQRRGHVKKTPALGVSPSRASVFLHT